MPSASASQTGPDTGCIVHAVCGHAHFFVLVVQDELLCESTLDVRTTFKFLDGDIYYVSIERMPPAPVLMLYDTEVCWSLFDIEGWHAPGEQSACSRVRWPCCCIHFRVVTRTSLASRVYQKPMTCYCCTTDHCGRLLCEVCFDAILKCLTGMPPGSLHNMLQGATETSARERSTAGVSTATLQVSPAIVYCRS